MLLWTIIALLTAAAIMAVLVPLGRTPAVAGAAEQAKRVYRDQLNEVERDRSDGRLGAAEAEAARTEIARRLLAVDADASGELKPDGSLTARRATSLLAIIGIPALSLSLYVALGAPDLPGQPLAARLAAPDAVENIEMLIARVEEHLAQSPDDGRGWDVVAPVYLQIGRAADAERAYRNAIDLLGETAARRTGLGEAIAAGAGGIVTAEARAAFEAATALDPAAPAPRFFLALAAEQEGDADGAAERLRALLADAPADASWRATVEATLTRIEQPAGPSAEQVAAAQNLSESEQAAMAEGMVASLAERLEREPDDVDGWLRLIRSYVVLGRPEDAAEAARAALAGVEGPAARSRVEALLAELSLRPAGASVE